MNLPAAAPEQTESTVSQTVPVVVLGTDALLAAAPYTAVQLAHACLQAGYVSVVPASWGDELVAAAVLRRLPRFGHGPAIQCSCPIVAHRLLTTGGDLRPVMLPLVSPPVALARYLRTISHPTRIRITYVGNCPGAIDDSIDIRMSPETLIGMLAERHIVLDDQPRVFESIIPPDRRRYYSQPGGVPSAERLWSDLGSRALVEVESDDFVSEIAQHLLAGEQVLMDVAPRLGCVCSGAVPGTAPRDARSSVVALEPPRSNAAVVEEQTPLDLDLPIPAVPRNPVDVALAARTPTSSLTLPTPPSPLGIHRTPTVTEPRVGRVPSPPTSRPATGITAARHVEGKPLPRTYVARRRLSTPRGHPTVPNEAAPEPGPETSPNPSVASVNAATTTHPPEPAGSTPAVDASSAPGRVEAVAPAPISAPAVAPVSAPVEPPHNHPTANAAASESTVAPPAAETPTPPAEAQAAPATALAPMTSEPVPDRDQLHLDGIAVAAQNRLPIFTPSPSSGPVPAARPAPKPSTPPAATTPPGRSRLVLYILIVAIALFAVAGIAYFAGRSTRGSETPTEQGR